jgi:hypothetical protein
MIDITGPKVLVPTILFALLSPGLVLALPPGSGLLTQTMFHALVFTLVSWLMIKFVFKFTLTRADIIVPLVYFIALTPGVLLSLPPSGGLITTVMVHAMVFSIVWASTRGLFPQFY